MIYELIQGSFYVFFNTIKHHNNHWFNIIRLISYDTKNKYLSFHGHTKAKRLNKDIYMLLKYNKRIPTNVENSIFIQNEGKVSGYQMDDTDNIWRETKYFTNNNNSNILSL